MIKYITINKDAIIRTIAVIVVVSFIAVLFMSVIAKATSSNGITFTDQNYTTAQFVTVATGTNYTYQWETFSSSQSFLCVMKQYNDNTYWYPLLISDISGNHTINAKINNNTTSKGATGYKIGSTSWYVYYTSGDQFRFNQSYTPIVPSYICESNEQWDDFLLRIVYDIEHRNDAPPTPTPEPQTIDYNLPAGNVAYIKLANSFDGFGLTTTMPVKSDAFSSTTGWNSTQRWGFTDNIATNGTQLANFGSQISWSKNNIQTNIFGQTQEAYYYPEGPFAQSEYLVIVNPLYYAIQYTNGDGVFPSDAGVNQTVNNNSIHINCDDAISITVFQLTQNVTINNNIPTYTNDVTSGPYEGEVDPDTGDITWTDPDGGSNQPTTGGGNVPGTGETSFTSVINGIANRIVNVFQPAHDAIITLSNAVTNFAGWLYALYVWLPAPILTLLTSAISVAIIIGVIKVFI